MSSSDRLSLTIALDTLNHLGMKLYSSLPPVLSELVANAYDARARNVQIRFTEDEIRIEDDGIGMDRADVQSKYLVVGRDRRVEELEIDPDNDPFSEWPRRDKPMGRKGIGKLAMFSIADEVEIHSTKSGGVAALRMDREGIERAASQKQTYYPMEVEYAADLTVGTRIVLRNLKRKQAISSERMLKAIARRFSIVDVDEASEPNEFKVHVDGTQVSVEHWDVFRKLQFAWILGSESKHFAARCENDCKVIEVANEVQIPDHGSTAVTGWIGTVRKPEQLKSASGGVDINDNRIVVDCRGKVAIANFLHQFGESGVYASYLAGYIRADYLDDGDDIATTDRERMQVDDPQVVALRSFVQSLLKRIQKEWTELRRTKAAEEATEDPVVAEWIDGLTEDEQKDARQLLGRIGGARFADKADRAQVIKYAILAFERLRVRHKLHVLRDAPDDRLDAIATLFALESDLENALYADIASQRLAVIEKLEALVDDDEKEKMIQQHIFDHLWLLEPSWTIQDQLSSRLEQQVATEFAGVSLTRDEKAGRIDIRYRKAGGIHIVVELKKPSVRRTVYQLLEQVKKYKSALSKCLLDVEGEHHPNIQCVCLVGAMPEVSPEEEGALQSAGTKVLTYDQVISDSCKRFAEYLDAQKRFGRIQSIVSRLDSVDGQ